MHSYLVSFQQCLTLITIRVNEKCPFLGIRWNDECLTCHK